MQANERYIDKNFCMYTMSYNSNNDIISDLYNGQPRDIYPVSFVMAAHWLVSMECLKKVGGFSPSFPHYGEDNNFIDRAVYHGFKVGICPQLKVVHDREYRIVSNEQKAYFAYSSCLVALSKPEYTRNKNVIYPFYYFLREALCANSLRGFKYIGRIYKEYSSIKKNRLVSKGKMPFLFMK
jgi:GT2 family glycosyltransferase